MRLPKLREPLPRRWLLLVLVPLGLAGLVLWPIISADTRPPDDTGVAAPTSTEPADATPAASTEPADATPADCPALRGAAAADGSENPRGPSLRSVYIAGETTSTAVSRAADRRTNPTAPTSLTKHVSGDLTDSDGDGMTDAAEIKYGFDPHDGASFPTEPAVVRTEQHPISGTATGAYYAVLPDGIAIRWKDPANSVYVLHLKVASPDERDIFFGGHPAESASVTLSALALSGRETLVGQFLEHDHTGESVRDHSQFVIDLSTIEFPELSDIIALVGDPSNRVSYTFAEDFPEDLEVQYREFLQRVFPILYEYLGPPAGTYNITLQYDEYGYVTLDGGRTILVDASFVPRLIVHELAHAWRGRYIITSDENWEYDPALTGFEEGLAEGMAFEIVREYVRSYPNDAASIQLLESRPHQYWPGRATYYDAMKNIPWTGGGDFWTHAGGELNRYNIAAATVQMLLTKNPNFHAEFMSRYYKEIRNDFCWRPNRNDIMGLWEDVVPELNGYPLSRYLDTVPVFNGHELDEGIYVLGEIRPYGITGDQNFAVSYALPDGRLSWGVESRESIPSWVPSVLEDDDIHYIDTQRTDFVVEVFDAYGQLQIRRTYKTNYDEEPNSATGGFGWYHAEELYLEGFPFGLYNETVTFLDFIDHDEGARESFYFFGLEDFQQDREEDYVVFIGVDGVPEGTAEIVVGDKSYISPIMNGAAVFRSREWPFDLQGEFPITIMDTASTSKTYYRTLIEAATIHDYFQHQFIIVDKDFNGVEDQFE